MTPERVIEGIHEELRLSNSVLVFNEHMKLVELHIDAEAKEIIEAYIPLLLFYLCEEVYEEIFIILCKPLIELNNISPIDVFNGLAKSKFNVDTIEELTLDIHQANSEVNNEKLMRLLRVKAYLWEHILPSKDITDQN